MNKSVKLAIMLLLAPLAGAVVGLWLAGFLMLLKDRKRQDERIQRST